MGNNENKYKVDPNDEFLKTKIPETSKPSSEKPKIFTPDASWRKDNNGFWEQSKELAKSNEEYNSNDNDQIEDFYKDIANKFTGLELSSKVEMAKKNLEPYAEGLIILSSRFAQVIDNRTNEIQIENFKNMDSESREKVTERDKLAKRMFENIYGKLFPEEIKIDKNSLNEFFEKNKLLAKNGEFNNPGTENEIEYMQKLVESDKWEELINSIDNEIRSKSFESSRYVNGYDTYNSNELMGVRDVETRKKIITDTKFIYSLSKIRDSVAEKLYGRKDITKEEMDKINDQRKKISNR